MYSALLFFEVMAADVYMGNDGQMETPKRFVPLNSDVYPSSGVDPLRVELNRGNLQREGQPGGFDVLYDLRYLSADPHIRQLEVLVLDEMCIRSHAVKGDPFNIFGTDNEDKFEDLDEEHDASFLDLSSIPIDNFHVLDENPVEKQEPIFQLPSAVVNLQTEKEPEKSQQKRRQTRKATLPLPEMPDQKQEKIPSEIDSGTRVQLMKEIRSTSDKPRVSFAQQHNVVNDTADESFFANGNQPLEFYQKPTEKSARTPKKNSLHTYINKPKPTSIMHSDSFRDAFSFAMQHRRSRLREDSKSSDASKEVSNDSFDFM